MERRTPTRIFNGNSSIRSSVSIIEIEEVEETEKVYVAVGKEYKESEETLNWVIQNISEDERIVVVLVHVHVPAKMIYINGARFRDHQLKEEQIVDYRQKEWNEMNKTLEKYLALCSQAMVQAEKLVIKMADIDKGLVTLINQHGITKLVMGTSTRQCSKRTGAPRSATASSVHQRADQSCKIWFVYNGKLISTRDSVLDGSRVGGSPTASVHSSQSNQSQTDQFGSISLPLYQTHTLHSPTDPVQRSMSSNYDSREREMMEIVPFGVTLNTSRSASISSLEGSVTDHWEDDTRRTQASHHSTLSLNNEVLKNMGSLQISRDEESEKSSEMLPSVHEPEEDPEFSTPGLELEYIGIDDELYEKLQIALKEAEDLKKEAYTESCRRSKAERDSNEAARRVKALENSYNKELKQRKDIEVTLARERQEMEKLRDQHDELMLELERENERKVQMELRVAASEQIIKDFQEELTEAKSLITSLQREHEDLRKDREEAIRIAEELRQKREEEATNSQQAKNFSEFTYSELQRATDNFNDSQKIGEGGYGSVYKGFLRHTMVAIKMLDPQSMQGQSEFYQEVKILSQVRHPNLVTLIGTCQEAWALIYEYLPQGSLEDCLGSKDNSLPWYVRIRIATEICSALIFLHSYKPHTVVHGDLTPSNILLDSNFISKLGDFGICRLIVQSNSSTTLYRWTNPKGTFVYMDPEFLSTGELTPRSDIYSFGVILLRVLTGRQALGIIRNVKEAMEGDRLHEILDTTAGDWPFVQAKQLANLALRCCQIERKNRPDLAKEAWRVLEPMMITVSSIGAPSRNSSIPSYFICPIFQEVMMDPHIAADGFTYEAEALKGWFDSGHDTSPTTNLRLPHLDLIPNHALRSAIQEWLQNQK